MAAGAKTQVLACKNEESLGQKDWRCFLQKLPRQLQQAALQFHRQEDRQASVFGKLLLMKGLNLLGHDPQGVQSIQFDDYKRPFLAAVKLDFNIAHTRGLVVCALSNCGKVGIDVELKRAVEMEDYQGVFTPREFGLIRGSPDPVDGFFHFWTRKEAVMKADGRGFYLSPKLFDAIADQVQINNACWHLQAVPMPGDYVCHLASEGETSVRFQLLDIQALLELRFNEP